MSDIANIGFQVNTSDLEKGSVALDKMKQKAAGMSSAVGSVTTAVEGNSLAAKKAALEIARSNSAQKKAILDTVIATKNSTKADRDAAAQALKTARAEESKTRSLYQAVKANEAVARSMRMATAESAKQLRMSSQFKAAAGRPTGGLDGVANDQMPNRFNTANIAAQFQDIGVTAAMGMNPLTVALQQGTQLSAILNSMESPLKGLAVAFKSIINPVSLMAIGFTAALVTLIQFVDWGKVAKSMLNGLADTIEAIGPLVLGLSVTLALIYAPAILSGLASAAVGIATLGKTALIAGAKMAAAWLIGLGPIGWIIAGIGAVLALMYIFRDALSNLLGVDVMSNIKTGVNKIIGFFVGAFNGIKAAWSALPSAIGDLIYQAANKVLGAVESMIMAVVERINKLPGVNIDLEFDGEGNLTNPFEGQAAAAGKIIGEEMDKALSKDYVGAIGEGIKGLATKVRGVASGIGTGEDGKKKGGKTEAEKAAEGYEKILVSANKRIATLKAEQAALGLTEGAATKLKYETELLNDAMQKGIVLTEAQKAQLGDLAQEMATIELQTKATKEAFDFAKSASSGFLDDMKQGLKEGQTLWEAFGNSVTNVLNKILDRMVNSGLDMLFDGLKGSSGGGGGFLSSVASVFGFGSSSSSTAPKPFAKGDAFTNGVYSSPTMFKFANGGSFGVMGEAGPEAVMPLHRGSDGSLGVRMQGGSSDGGNVVVNVINNSKASARVQERQTGDGVELDVLVDEMMANNIGEQGTLSNRALRSHNQRSLIKRG